MAIMGDFLQFFNCNPPPLPPRNGYLIFKNSRWGGFLHFFCKILPNGYNAQKFYFLQKIAFSPSFSLINTPSHPFIFLTLKSLIFSHISLSTSNFFLKFSSYKVLA